MPIDLLEIFNIISGSCKIKVTPEKTSQISALIQGLEDPEQIESCVRIFLTYYPEESLIALCLNRLFIDNRPNNLTARDFSNWQQQVSLIANNMRQQRVRNGEN